METYNWIKPNVKAIFKAPNVCNHPIEKLICKELEGAVFTIKTFPQPCSKTLSGYTVEIEESDALLNAAQKVAYMFGATVDKSGATLDCACLHPLDDDKKDEEVKEVKTIPWDDLCKEFGIDPARVNEEVTA